MKKIRVLIIGILFFLVSALFLFLVSADASWDVGGGIGIDIVVEPDDNQSTNQTVNNSANQTHENNIFIQENQNNPVADSENHLATNKKNSDSYIKKENRKRSQEKLTTNQQGKIGINLEPKKLNQVKSSNKEALKFVLLVNTFLFLTFIFVLLYSKRKIGNF